MQICLQVQCSAAEWKIETDISSQTVLKIYAHGSAARNGLLNVILMFNSSTEYIFEGQSVYLLLWL